MKKKARKLSIFILIVFMLFGNCSFFYLPIFQIKKAQAASLITAFVYKKDITFDTTAQGANVSTAQANFPVAVHINSSSWSNATERGHFFGAYNNVSGHEGKRIQFFDSDGTTNLSYEVEYYSNANQEAIYWVRVPSVAGNSATDKITVAYGNDPNGADQDSATSVWSNGFVSVYHLGDNQWGTTPEAKDSLAANNGTNTSTADADAKIRRGRSFTASSAQYITLANEGNFDFERTNSFSVSLWAKQNNTTDTFHPLISKFSSAPVGWEFNLYSPALANSNAIDVQISNTWGAPQNSLANYAASGNVGTNLRYMGFTYDGTSTPSGLKLYLDGISQTTTNYRNNLSASILNNQAVTIGKRSGASNYHEGTMDEVRISNTLRTDDWIKLEYYSTAKTNYNGDNGAGTSKFITFGSEQASGTLSVDIVDGSGNSVASPSVAFASKAFSFANQDSTGTFGTSSQKIRVSNITGTQTWTANLAGSATTATWTSGSDHYDFNDGSGYTDGADADSYGGQMTVDPSGGTIAGVSGCSTSNVSKGTSDSFVEGSNNSIDLFSASVGAAAPCKWDLTGVSLIQKIPASQPAGSYAINLVLTVQ